MTLDKNKEYQKLAIAAARMFCDSTKQVDIAEALGKSQGEISRLLTYAEKQKYMSRKPRIRRDAINERDWSEVEQRYFGDSVTHEALQKLAPRDLVLDVRVFQGSYEDFTDAAAGRLAELLPRSNRIGILWGRTIFQVLEGVSARANTFDHAKHRDVICVPLCGDPVFLMSQRMLEYSASWLAASLEQTLTGNDNPEAPCLTGVPAYISTQTAANSDAGKHWLDFIRKIPGYQKIFGDGKRNTGLVDQVDTVITGVGMIATGTEKPNMSTGDFIKERIEQDGISKKALDRLVYGEIGGYLLEREGLSEKDRRLVMELNRGWTGINGDHFKRISRDAWKNGKPGIVLVAFGASKSDLIRTVVKRGFVNRLIIDAELAKKLKQLT